MKKTPPKWPNKCNNKLVSKSTVVEKRRAVSQPRKYESSRASDLSLVDHLLKANQPVIMSTFYIGSMLEFEPQRIFIVYIISNRK